MDIFTLDKSTIVYINEFIESYKSSPDNKFGREVDCLKVQVPYEALSPRENDFICGRKKDCPVGFLPQTSFNSFGYYCDNKSLLDYKKTLKSEKEKENIDDIINFFKGKTSNEKTYDSYSKEIKEQLVHEDYLTTPGCTFPLYRMSGAQMDPTFLLENGIEGIALKCKLNFEKNPDFYSAEIEICNILSDLILQYKEICIKNSRTYTGKKKNKFLKMAENLNYISTKPPKTFWQAIQLSYLFYVTSGTFNYGRTDDYLGVFLVNDLKSGEISKDFALELIKNLFSLMDERDSAFDGRVILGGKGRKHPEEADIFDLIAIEASKELKLPLPQLTLRCYDGMNTEVYEKALDCIGSGTTYPMLYNDDRVIKMVSDTFNVSLDEAEQYTPFGCGEYVIYNKSFGTPSGAINLLYSLNETIYGDESWRFKKALSYDQFYKLYCEYIENQINLAAEQEMAEYKMASDEAGFLFYSMLFENCLDKGKPIFDGGIKYLGGTLETYGNINVTNSLFAIKSLVFDKKTVEKQRLIYALKTDFRDDEELLHMLEGENKFGNDIEDIDKMAEENYLDVFNMINSCSEKVGLSSYLPVVINNSMNTIFGLTTGASADGRRKNTYMANANNPFSGTDKCGITALIKSLSRISSKPSAGIVQNFRFSKEMFNELLTKTKILLSAYFENGGSQAMITVVGRGELEKAIIHPELYRNLIVRVGGFSARFVELSSEIQSEIISRTLY